MKTKKAGQTDGVEIKNDIRTIIADVDKSKAFKKDLKYYGLTVKNVSIVYQRRDEQGNVYFDLLRKGKQPLVSIHLAMEKGKLQIDSMQVDSGIHQDKDAQRAMETGLQAYLKAKQKKKAA